MGQQRNSWRRRRWLSLLSIAAVALVALLVTQVAEKINTQVPVASDTRPVLPTANIVTGLASYHWLTSQVGWLNLSAPGSPADTSADGWPTQPVDTVIARTVDGGRSWHSELRITGLVWRWYEQFPSPMEAMVVGQRAFDSGSEPAIVVWRTADGGAHWSTSSIVVPPGDVRAVGPGSWVVYAAYFQGSRQGWVLLGALYTCGGCMDFVRYALLYRTDDGIQWTKVANVPAVWISTFMAMRFSGPDFGVISTFGAAMGVTHDGGNTWTEVQRPVPEPPTPLSTEVLMEPTSLFSPREAAFAVDVADVVKVPCLDRSGHNAPLPDNVPPYCQNGDTVWVAKASYGFASRDGGATWTQTGPIPARGELSYGDGLARVDFVTQHLWIVAGVDGLAESNDGGTTWSTARKIPIPPGWYVADAEFVNSTQGWITLSDNAQGSYITRLKQELFPYPWPKFSMLATTDGGATWSQVALPQA